ncbi:MAG: hypothetical protein RJA00_1653 [Bacteroidota bacterium]|jgi:hypothetical protein
MGGLRFSVLIVLFISMWTNGLLAQNAFSLGIQPLKIPNMPQLHSFAAAQYQGKWYLFGGRRDGLHRRQPFRAFDSAHANRYIYCVDPESQTVDSLSIQNLNPSLQSQLASTNMLFHQEDNLLYLVGGYGLPCRNDISLFSPPSRFTDPEAHRTFPYLTKVDLAKLSSEFAKQTEPNSRKNQINKKQPPLATLSSAFEQWTDPQFALTGGAMFNQIDYYPHKQPINTFYLVGGHRFDGLYNPMGPQNGPGFEQEYHHGVRRFQLTNVTVKSHKKRKTRKKSTQTKEIVIWHSPLIDSQFRRRDVNVMESLHHRLAQVGSGIADQILIDGDDIATSPFPPVQKDLLVFSGVFQERANIPYTNLLEINADSSTIKPIHRFNQLLNQYHSAHTSLYSYKVDAQFFLFFGGIAQYFFNDSGLLTQDPDVPVVSTVSLIERTAANEYSEYALPIHLPKGVGAGTEFILANTVPRMEGTDVIDLESLQGDSQLLGYLVGGFSTTAPNVFFDNDADESKAESHAYAVYWKRNNELRDPAQKLALKEAKVVTQGNNGQIHFQAFTNTENGKVYFMIQMEQEGPCTLTLRDESNKTLLRHEFPGGLPKGESVFALPLYDPNRAKTYQVVFEAGGVVLQEQLIINP